jgi:hypothetical protein
LLAYQQLELADAIFLGKAGAMKIVNWGGVQSTEQTALHDKITKRCLLSRQNRFLILNFVVW